MDRNDSRLHTPSSHLRTPRLASASAAASAQHARARAARGQADVCVACAVDCVRCCGVVVVHERVLVSVYRSLCGASECPPMYGSHWEAVGFQGSDPATDVRGGGLFSLVQLLSFVQGDSRELALRLFQLSNDPVQHFPFSVVALNVSGFVLAALRSGVLHGECSRRGDVWLACQALFAAAMSSFHRQWKEQSATISSWSSVRQSTTANTQPHPQQPRSSTTPLLCILMRCSRPLRSSAVRAWRC